MKKRHMDVKMICFLVRCLLMKSVIVSSHLCSIKTSTKGEEGRKRVWMNVHLKTEGLIPTGNKDSRRLNSGIYTVRYKKSVPQFHNSVGVVVSQETITCMSRKKIQDCKPKWQGIKMVCSVHTVRICWNSTLPHKYAQLLDVD